MPLYFVFSEINEILVENREMKIQHGGSHHIEFRKKSLYPGRTTGIDCKMAFSLHVVESVSDEYNF